MDKVLFGGQHVGGGGHQENKQPEDDEIQSHATGYGRAPEGETAFNMVDGFHARELPNDRFTALSVGVRCRP